MVEAQRNFDKFVAPHSPEYLTSPLLHRVLDFQGIAEHIYGGKGVGSQGDGTAQLVCRSASDRDYVMAEIEKEFPEMRCFPLTIRGNVLVETDSQSRLQPAIPVRETGTKDRIDNQSKVTI